MGGLVAAVRAMNNRSREEMTARLVELAQEERKLRLLLRLIDIDEQLSDYPLRQDEVRALRDERQQVTRQIASLSASEAREGSTQ